MWERLSMKTMRDYTRHYMVLDVLILADVFEKFRHTMYNAHGLECPVSYTHLTLPTILRV